MASILLPMLMVIGFAFTFPTSGHYDDLSSLLTFKSAIVHDPFNLLLDWKSNPNNNNNSNLHCHWYGVSCSSSASRVVSLNLTSGSLVGTLSPSILNLTHLRILSLPHNLFSGHIPSVPSLHILELQGNNFSGHIPPHITRSSSLRLLNLSSNALSGPIPHGLIGGGRLTSIDLSNNYLSGGLTVSQPCPFLRHLKLSNNYLVDQIPSAIGNCSNLTTLLLDGNIFQGKIPADLGLLSQLIVLDVSRNSLTDAIPRELSACRKLSVIVLTNLVDSIPSSVDEDVDTYRGEFNAFQGGIPHELLLLPQLEIFWAPRSNLGGTLPANWSDSCSLRMLNLGQNYITGTLPETMVMCCNNLFFLDLGSNRLQGQFPSQVKVPCMFYLNVSHNSFYGFLPSFRSSNCSMGMSNSSYFESYPTSNFSGIFRSSYLMSMDTAIALDFSWNGFAGPLPSFMTGHKSLLTAGRASYQLFLNNNKFNGSLPDDLFSECNELHSLSLNLNANQISGWIDPLYLRNCLKLTAFEAVGNQLRGTIPPEIGSLKMLERLDLSRNRLSGSLPSSLGGLNNLKWVLLGENRFTGTIPAQLGQLTSLSVLLLDHNILSGDIPLSFSNLTSLTQLNLSFNNLSGHIPQLPFSFDCDSFKGNLLLQTCSNKHLSSPAGLPVPLEIHQGNSRMKLKSFVIAVVTSATVVLCVLVVIAVMFYIGRRKLGRLISLKRKVLVTFVDAPPELNYDNVVAATGNFSISNLIGTGGFGSTYKAELLPGFLVAVKRLSIGRFQGIQQFDAEIRTLGTIRHEKLVTLIGYYVGEDEMFLVYNYLSGGNLERFIHERPGEKFQLPMILKIANDIAEALTFLHNTCMPRIVHRDIKPSNILLDQQLNAYLSDFGLARLIEVTETHATTDVAGTFGYVAPEYATTCRVTEKSDVYSFGVVLLELVSGKKSLDPSFSEYGNGFNIVAWAELLISEGRSSEAFSPELWQSGTSDHLMQLLKLASACTVESLSVRPSMHQVLQKLKQLQT